jgi:hypothetical protein
MAIRDTIESTPLVDNHAHEVQPLPDDLRPETFAGYFTEGPGSEQARHTVHYRVGLDLLADHFDGDSEAELIAQRAAVDLEAYANDLIGRANVSHIVQDTGTPPGSDPEAFTRYTDADIRPVLRIENLVEDLLERTDSFAAFEATFEDRVEDALTGDHVGLKSIVAYRTGLDVGAPSRGEAAKAYVEATADWDGRIDHPVLLDYALNRAATLAGDHDVPLQFHTGFGDADAHPLYVDPGHLYDLLQSHPDTDFVLLHASYPYVQKAGYIASVLENVYVDLGMTIPFVQHGAESLLGQAFELAPATRLLYSSDGYVIPEWYYLAARRMRSALGTVLEDLIDEGFVGESYAETMATAVLRDNAMELYDL